MSAEGTESLLTLLTADHPRGHSRTRNRTASTLTLPIPVEPGAAIGVLLALIARYARAENVTVYFTARAMHAFDPIAASAVSTATALVTIPMHAGPSLRDMPHRMETGVRAARSTSAVSAASILIDVGTPMPDASDAEFSVCLTPAADELRYTIDCDRSLFDSTTVNRFGAAYGRMLRAALADPARSLERIPLIGAEETEQLVHAWNATSVPRTGQQVMHRLIEAQSARTPNAVAVEFNGQTLTYGALNALANSLARTLIAHGVGADATVGLCVERSLELPVALLAIHKAGAAFLPLDPELPRERLAFMLADSGTRLVLTQERLTAVRDAVVVGGSVALLSVDGAAGGPTDDSANPDDRCAPDSLAYVMYTSGSTGRPKGVMVPHRALCNHALWFSSRLEMTATDRMLQHASISFDAALAELFAPLAVGATVVLADPAAHRDILAIPDSMRRLRISVAQMVPSTLRVAVSDSRLAACTGLRYLVSGGEALDASLAMHVRRLLPMLRLGNFYGPTEATVDATSYEVTGHEEQGIPLPIGRPIDNAWCRVLDAHGALVPVGVPGELFVGGHGVAVGYVNMTEQTALRFIPDPYRAGATLYRTGDLARYRSDGTLEYLGRADTQVKLRGYRIELAEVEALLLMDRRVRGAAVVLREDVPGEQRLVAYVVKAEAALTSLDVRDTLRSRLPDYMVPEAYCFLDALPVTVSGKLDRRALPLPDAIARVPTYAVSLTDPIERSLQAIWEHALGYRPIGPDDDFFLLGGHSLKAIRVLAEIERVHGVTIRAATLFEAPTIRTLAARMRETTPREVTTIIPVQRKGAQTPLFFAPGGGGELFVFDALARALGDQQPLYVLDMYVFDEISLPQATITLAGVAARMIADIRHVQPTGPYQLAGYSLGGNIVFEIAQQLHRAGEQVQLLALLDCDGPGYPHVQPFAKRTLTHIKHALSLGAMDGLRYLCARLGNATHQMLHARNTELVLYADQEEAHMVPAHVIDALEHALKPVIDAWEQYVPQYYPGSALVIRADVRRTMIGVIDADLHLGWGPVVGGGVRSEAIVGDHFTILHATHAERLAEILTRHMLPVVGAEAEDAEPRAALPALAG